jgi:hypothetical protein
MPLLEAWMEKQASPPRDARADEEAEEEEDLEEPESAPARRALRSRR